MVVTSCGFKFISFKIYYYQLTKNQLNKNTCPLPEEVLSSSAAIIPMAHTKLPPAKSANKFIGAKGFSFFLPRKESTPENLNIS